MLSPYLLTIITGLALCIVATLVLNSAGNTQPGDLITIEAECAYSDGQSPTPLVDTAYTTIAVLSPVTLSSPVYLAQGWSNTYTRPDGTSVTVTNKLAAGMLVRAFVKMDDQVKLVDGIQLSNGRVWVNGEAYDRADPLTEPGG